MLPKEYKQLGVDPEGRQPTLLLLIPSHFPPAVAVIKYFDAQELHQPLVNSELKNSQAQPSDSLLTQVPETKNSQRNLAKEKKKTTGIAPKGRSQGICPFVGPKLPASADQRGKDTHLCAPQNLQEPAFLYAGCLLPLVEPSWDSLLRQVHTPPSPHSGLHSLLQLAVLIKVLPLI